LLSVFCAKLLRWRKGVLNTIKLYSSFYVKNNYKASEALVLPLPICKRNRRSPTLARHAANRGPVIEVHDAVHHQLAVRCCIQSLPASSQSTELPPGALNGPPLYCMRANVMVREREQDLEWRNCD
jgi:hypothetical protein